ncbi:TPA: G5 domain-containing protein [Streptococcus suis]|nr:G5 domain-containing protein [Streptococcus suis]
MKKRILYFVTLIVILMFPTKLLADNGIGMYRLYNPNSGEHFYTASIGERDFLKKVGWKYEGGAWTAPTNGEDVYRLYNPNAGDHHYTTSKAEKDKLVKVGWKYEGVGWKSGGSSKVYRLYNPNAKGAGAHHYTLSKGEYDFLVKKGWKGEKVGWYADDTFEPGVILTTKTESKKEILKYNTITKDDSNLYKGETKVEIKGQDGYIETTYKITYKNGIESRRQKVGENKKDAVNEIILSGTKDKITTKTETTKEILYFSSVIQGDDTMLIGETRLKNKGENGYVESTYKITFKNGVEIGRELINQNRKEPINEVTLEGNLEQYTQEVDVFDENYQMIKTEYVEDSSVPYGQTKVLTEGEEGYYTIKSLFGTIISKELTPPKNEVIGIALGDVAMPDTYGTLFMYLNKYNEDQLFDFANKYNIHLLHFSKDELVKIKNTIDMDLVTKYFLEYLNADRVAQGLEPVTSTTYGREIATIRAQEQADYGHYYTDGERDVRPDGSSWRTVDNKGVALFEYVTSAPEEFHRIISEKYLAMNFYYNIWKNHTSYSFIPNYSKVSLGLGVAKGSLRNGNSIQFGRDEGWATAVVAFIAE